MPFRPDRLKVLRDAKDWGQDELSRHSGLSQSVIAKSEKGTNVPGSDALEKLAQALDCTTDYLLGRGPDYASVAAAAAHMAFEVFITRVGFSDEQRERYRRVLQHPDAPKTAQGWGVFAEKLELAMGRTPPTVSPSLVEAHGAKSKPMAVSRRFHRHS
jgi:transcriptional regulator with XRE-family HTH domain